MQNVISFRAMGCQVNVVLESIANGHKILQEVPAWIEAIEASLSRFRPQSELSQLNAHVGEWVPVSDVLLANIQAAKHGARLTDGLYNPLILDALLSAGYDRSFEQLQTSTGATDTVPATDWRSIHINTAKSIVHLSAPIDLGGVAKGWAAQHIAQKLSEYGACLVDIGGDIAVSGTSDETPAWEITVAEPGIDDKQILTIGLKSGSIVTSGTDYRRWLKNGQPQHHLIDPRTGLPCQTDVVSATVIHSHAPTAEVYAKAIIMLGSKTGLEWINQQWERAALIVCHDGSVIATDAFEQFILEGVSE